MFACESMWSVKGLRGKERSDTDPAFTLKAGVRDYVSALTPETTAQLTFTSTTTLHTLLPSTRHTIYSSLYHTGLISEFETLTLRQDGKYEHRRAINEEMARACASARIQEHTTTGKQQHTNATMILQSSPRPQSPVNSATATGSTTARPASPKAPGGPATAIRRKAAADRADKVANQRPSSTRAAGAGGSSSTMLSKLD